MYSTNVTSIISPIDIAKTQDLDIPEIVYFQSLLESANGNFNLFVDVTDYILFFTRRTRVSGIQRVVHSLVKYLDVSHFDGLSAVAYCVIHPDTGLFGLVSPSLFSELFSAVDLGKDLKSIHRYANNILKKTSFRPYLPLTRHDCLLIPGGPWAAVLQLNLYCLEKKRIGFSAYCVCYDLIPIDFPEFCATGLSKVFKQTYSKLSGLCEGFISISNYSSKSIENYESSMGLTRLHSAYQSWRLGDYDDNFSVAPNVPPVELRPHIDKITQNGYLLVVSTIEPRKNHQSILRAWRLLLQEHNLEYESLPAIVFAGAVGWISNDLIEQINSMRESGLLIFVIENLSDSSISWLYKNCIFSIMPSFVEGWGLSIPESIMRGKVCLTSETSSMKEASFGLAPLFDPYSIRDLASKLYQLLYEDKLSYYEELLLEYQPFSWRESSLEFYKKLGSLYANFKKGPKSFQKIPQTIDILVNDLVGLFIPSDHIDSLGESSDWFPASMGSILNAFSTRPSLRFTLPKFPAILKLYINHYSSTNIVLVSLFDDSGTAIRNHSSTIDMGNGEMVHYLYLTDSERATFHSRTYTLLFEGNPADERSPHQVCVNGGPSSWFGIRRIEFHLS